ncbi:MAG: hypothetical protein LW724_19755 [Planctomycetaceae bacterium]|nr:hypothetical protein [Planctomycetaceae bacterium]
MKSFQQILLFAMLAFALACASPFVAQDSWAGNPQGEWKGRWQSQSTGHSGPMRVVISPTSRGTYQARFTGRFAAVIPFAYRAELIPQTSFDGKTVLTSSKKLGPILGSYQMQTEVSGNVLSGDFQAAGDRGSIMMRRVGR